MNIIGQTAQAKVKNFQEKLINSIGLFFVQRQYRLGHTVLKGYNANIYCIYKREFFHTFSKQFKDFISRNPIFENVEGESINLEALNNAIKHDCEFIVFLYPNKTYYIYTVQLKRFCEANGLIRGQLRLNHYLKANYTGKLTAEQEITYSFPNTLLTEVRDLGVFK